MENQGNREKQSNNEVYMSLDEKINEIIEPITGNRNQRVPLLTGLGGALFGLIGGVEGISKLMTVGTLLLNPQLAIGFGVAGVLSGYITKYRGYSGRRVGPYNPNMGSIDERYRGGGNIYQQQYKQNNLA